jgi:hypothetical protein
MCVDGLGPSKMRVKHAPKNTLWHAKYTSPPSHVFRRSRRQAFDQLMRQYRIMGDDEGTFSLAVWIPPNQKSKFDDEGRSPFPDEGDVLKLRFNISKRLPGYIAARPIRLHVSGAYTRPWGATGTVEARPVDEIDAVAMRSVYKYLHSLHAEEVHAKFRV